MTETPAPLLLADFADHPERSYRALIAPSGSVELELTETISHGDPRPFSLRFRGPLSPELVQSTYAIEHPSFDEPHPIFLVPIGRDADGMSYEAVFA